MLLDMLQFLANAQSHVDEEFANQIRGSVTAALDSAGGAANALSDEIDALTARYRELEGVQ
jgi:hypothetical protein